MSFTPLIRYDLDPTGSSPDNAVIGEIKNLSLTQIRAIAPSYGPFFSDSVVIYDNENGRLLERGNDYRIVEMLQSATMKFGKEIAQLILLVNPAIGSQVRLNYQVLGGLYQNSAEDLVNMYNSVIKDDRPIDWTNVLNKPSEYPPTLHHHLLEDIYGFESIVVALERVRQATVLADVPAFEAVIDWVRDNSGTSVFVDPSLSAISRLHSKTFNIRTANNKNGTKYFWSIRHHGTEDINFQQVTGETSIFQNRAMFTVKTSAVPPLGVQTFDIVLRKDRPTGPVMTTVEGIRYLGKRLNDLRTGPMSTAQLLASCCLTRPGIRVNARSMYLVGD